MQTETAQKLDGILSDPASLAKIAKAYSSPPWWYDARGFFILTFAYRGTLWEQVRFFGRNIGEKHLEVAIGTGTLYGMIRSWRKWKGMREHRVSGIDYALPMLAGAIRHFRKQADVELCHADAAALPYADDTFDSANIANALHCIPDVDGALRETFRVLRPGGRMAANVLLYPRGKGLFRSVAAAINRWGIRKGILHTPYEQADIRSRILAAGFEILREEVSGNAYNVVAHKQAKIETRGNENDSSRLVKKTVQTGI
jgi:ubiquinone/menaquinone biosynthesis C-methylase UbiE